MKKLIAVSALLPLLFPVHLVAEQAKNSEIMAGFPPTAETQVTFANYRDYGKSKWSFNNISAVYNTAQIPRGLKSWQFKDSGNKLSKADANKISQVFAANDADSVIIIKDGAILHEQYWNFAAPQKKHIWFSVTKSLVSASFGVLVEQGKVKLTDSPAKYLPELKGSGFERVTIQQLLNHSTGIDFKENYTDLSSDFLRYYAPAMNMAYIPGGRDANPKNTDIYGIYDFLANFIKANKAITPGDVFEYNSANTDVLGWLISRLSGMPLNDYIYQHIWRKIGADHDAFIAVDRAYMPVATAGMNSTLRDAAKFGQMILQDGQLNGEQVLPKTWLDRITQVSAVQKAKMKANPKYKNAGWEAYNNMWWILDSDKGEFAGSGIHGQVIYINKSKNTVAVFFSSQKIAANPYSKKYANKLKALRKVVSQL